MNNQVTFAGYVGNDPIERDFEGDKKLAKFSLAVKQFKSQGEAETRWLDIEGWNGLAPKVLAHVTKGREIVVNGRLALSEYIDNEGTKVIRPVVKLSGFYLCGAKPKAQSPTRSRARKIA